ncbi:hypothetical protein [Bacillus gobiensis]|uniref:Uncharacterized protein n=1 Tax=Bacillus gobiensis TaxID=1441095 RepID=A0A0M3R8X4_9BACI|nr:hypothetical protein [Bacillus gobiensis]ALC80436.1 hypothetical protein AM592_01675 [Bacillus gobiensis]
MDESKKKLIEGTALFLSFLITSIVLYFIPDFIGNQIVTRSIGIIFGLIGIMGFTVELTNLRISSNEEIKSALMDMVVGLFLGIIIFLLLYFFANWFVHIVVTLLMLLAIYAALRSVIKLIFLTDFLNRNILIKLPVIILNIAIFTLTLLQVLQIFKVIK